MGSGDVWPVAMRLVVVVVKIGCSLHRRRRRCPKFQLCIGFTIPHLGLQTRSQRHVHACTSSMYILITLSAAYDHQTCSGYLPGQGRGWYPVLAVPSSEKAVPSHRFFFLRIIDWTASSAAPPFTAIFHRSLPSHTRFLVVHIHTPHPTIPSCIVSRLQKQRQTTFASRLRRRGRCSLLKRRT